MYRPDTFVPGILNRLDNNTVFGTWQSDSAAAAAAATTTAKIWYNPLGEE